MKNRLSSFRRILEIVSCKWKQLSIPKLNSDVGQPALATKNMSQEGREDTSSNTTCGTVAVSKACQHDTNESDNGDCNGSPTGLLTGSEITRYGIIEEGFHESCLQITSYDLRVGEGHMVYEADKEKWSAQWIKPDRILRDSKNPPFEPIGDKLVIPRYGMALIQLRETVDLRSCMENKDHPVMICGHFDLKLSRVKEGVISQQATQVEPGYKGKLFCYLFNQSGEDIYLSYSDINNAKIATIEFQYVSCVSQCDGETKKQLIAELEKEHEKYSGSPFCTAHGIMDVRFFDGSLPKNAGLSVISKRLDEAHQEARDAFGVEIERVKKSISLYENWNIRLAAFVFALLIAIIASESIQTRLLTVWTKINNIRTELVGIKTEENAARASLQELQRDARKAYKMAQEELDKLDRQKTELLLLKASSASGVARTRSVQTDKGGEP